MKNNVTKVDFSKNKRTEKKISFFSLKKFFIGIFGSKKAKKENNKIIPYSRYIS
ncbi:hypothetical protein [Clostridium sp.]|jgi:hypothetical protein|uniref:hypothetical protein n=1 Tax=Clostridium sp. TaxID=1506 RepID=UPI002FDE4202